MGEDVVPPLGPGYSNDLLFILTPPPIALSPGTGVLTGCTVGAAYSQPFTASGGTAPYTFDVITGALPGGLALSTAGVMAGTCTTASTYSFTIQATDTNAATGSAAYTLVAAVPVPTLPGWGTALLGVLLLSGCALALRGRPRDGAAISN